MQHKGLQLLEPLLQLLAVAGAALCRADALGQLTPRELQRIRVLLLLLRRPAERALRVLQRGAQRARLLPPRVEGLPSQRRGGASAAIARRGGTRGRTAIGLRAVRRGHWRPCRSSGPRRTSARLVSTVSSSFALVCRSASCASFSRLSAFTASFCCCCSRSISRCSSGAMDTRSCHISSSIRFLVSCSISFSLFCRNSSCGAKHAGSDGGWHARDRHGGGAAPWPCATLWKASPATRYCPFAGPERDRACCSRWLAAHCERGGEGA